MNKFVYPYREYKTFFPKKSIENKMSVKLIKEYPF